MWLPAGVCGRKDPALPAGEADGIRHPGNAQCREVDAPRTRTAGCREVCQKGLGVGRRKRSFLCGRPITDRGHSFNKEGQSPESSGLGGLSGRRSLQDGLLDGGGGEQCLWEDRGASQTQRQEQRREFGGLEEPHLAGMEASHVGASWAVRVGR